MNKTVGESISLWDTSKEMRTISCQWWVGDRAGAEDDALPGSVPFDPDKTYTVKVTIKRQPRRELYLKRRCGDRPLWRAFHGAK